MSEQEPITHEGSKVRAELMDLAVGGVVPALVIAVGSAIHIFRGSDAIDGVWPLLGSVGSIAALLAYSITMSLEMTSGRRMWQARVANWGILVPWSMSVFVCGYWGVWGLVRLFTSGFSVFGLLGSLFWLMVGYRLINRTWLLTEVIAAVRTGRVVVLPEPANASA